MNATIRRFPKERGHTYAFLKDARNTAHIYLLADVDASAMKAARMAAKSADGSKISYISLIVKAAAQVVATSKEARTVLKDGFSPKLVTTTNVTAKVLFDKHIGNTRCVVSGTVNDPDLASVREIQACVDLHKDASVGPSGPFAALSKLHRLPLPLMRLAYNLVLGKPLKRAELQGNFSVTSVGQEDVSAILPMIAGTVGLGVGRIAEKPVVVDGAIVVRPQFTLSLTFDHRVLDGALAAEILGKIKKRLENWEMEQ
ncbi:2-oxo acid dehydrogenase subunit E2 [Rhizobium sp.]|jgi:pyruvate/2-oxoglutarate dehydrogenase complex dihydrolipoamide acyltransferase (E2) component|uniref:2-oxo acid dehydrogenase subunit E2 n=1 Tax=Rhizobium sp. TaxID=391 RepID=UPI000E8AE550|nr:dehydrogenase [Rhizobium sp.]